MIAKHLPDAAPLTLELEVGGSASAGARPLESLLGLRYAFSKSIEIELDWPLVLLDGTSRSACLATAQASGARSPGRARVSDAQQRARRQLFLRVRVEENAPLATLAERITDRQPEPPGPS